jgi:hypothetical protein
MVTSGDQNAGRSHNIKINNSSFERVEQFKYLGTTLTYQNSIKKETMCRLMSGAESLVFQFRIQNIMIKV